MVKSDEDYGELKDPALKRRQARHKIKPFLFIAGSFSVVVNLLMLVTPLYMLQVYDRVLTTGSLDTLILISVLAIGLMITYVFADNGRRHALALAANYMQNEFGETVFRKSLSDISNTSRVQKDLSDLNVVQAFFSNGLILPLFDLPFTPIFILIMFLIHPVIGALGVAGAVVLLLIAIYSEFATKTDEQQAQSVELQANKYAIDVARQQSAIKTMGMEAAAYQGWNGRKSMAGDLSLGTSKTSNFFGSLTRSIRQSLQILALGIGGWLVLQHQATPGVIIAGSILIGRAMGPIDHCVSMWRQIIRARQSWRNLKENISADDDMVTDDYTRMPRPEPKLEMTNLVVGFEDTNTPLIPKFNLKLQRPTIIAIVGPSGAGKSTLLQTIVGARNPLEGTVSMGGRDLHRWHSVDRGQYVGYLPQDVELLSGTIAQNIGRFSQFEGDEVLSVAQKCGFHDIFLSLPDGYDTSIGMSSFRLSGGQKQAVGVARAFFRNPVLIALDEPSSNLDSAKKETLRSFFSKGKENGNIIIYSSHDPDLIAIADQIILIMNGGIKLVDKEAYQKAITAQKVQPKKIIENAL